MRKSPLKTPIALLRHILGMKLEAFAALVGAKRSAVQNAELGRRPLSDDLALSIQTATGVSVEWLRGSNVLAPCVTRTGAPFTKESFQNRRAFRNKFPDSTRAFEHDRTFVYGCIGLSLALDQAWKKGRSADDVSLFFSKLTQLISSFEHPRSPGRVGSAGMEREIERTCTGLRSSYHQLAQYAQSHNRPSAHPSPEPPAKPVKLKSAGPAKSAKAKKEVRRPVS